MAKKRKARYIVNLNCYFKDIVVDRDNVKTKGGSPLPATSEAEHRHCGKENASLNNQRVSSFRSAISVQCIETICQSVEWNTKHSFFIENKITAPEKDGLWFLPNEERKILEKGCGRYSNWSPEFIFRFLKDGIKVNSLDFVREYRETCLLLENDGQYLLDVRAKGRLKILGAEVSWKRSRNYLLLRVSDNFLLVLKMIYLYLPAESCVKAPLEDVAISLVCFTISKLVL